VQTAPTKKTIESRACHTAGALGGHSESLGGLPGTNSYPCSSFDGDSYAGGRRHSPASFHCAILSRPQVSACVRLHGFASSSTNSFLSQYKTSCHRRYLLLSLLDYICAVGSPLAEGPEPVPRNPSPLLICEAATVELCRPRQPKKAHILSRSALGVSSIKSSKPRSASNRFD